MGDDKYKDALDRSIATTHRVIGDSKSRRARKRHFLIVAFCLFVIVGALYAAVLYL